MSNDHCHCDAAYVLGALSSSERRAYETHLADCGACQQSVREFAGLPGLIAKVRPEDFQARSLPPPASLLPTLVSAVRHERTRRRWVGAGIAAAAAVTVAVTTVGVGRTLPSTTESGASMAMRQVIESPVRATARLTNEPWGTQIDVACTYDSNNPYGFVGHTYTLVVTNLVGDTQQVATWKVVPSGVSVITGSVGWKRNHIAQIEIRTPQGAPVLRLPT